MEHFEDDGFAVSTLPAVSPGNGQGLVPAAPAAPNSLTAVEQSRAVAEIQAALCVAAARPRSEIASQSRILDACKRPSLAATAIYSYPKGGTQVEGPSIRLAETIARAWGNIDFGLKELSRENGVSEIEAYAWDLETNVRRVLRFQVRHWRDTKKGGYQLKEERDIYELTANQGQRRVRSCILGVIPGDIVESALEQCNRTLAGQSDKPLKERVQLMVNYFAAMEVSEKMIQDRIGHKLDTITEIEYRQLGKLYNSIKDAYITVEDAFEGATAKKETKKPAEAPPTEPDKTTAAATETKTEAQTPPPAGDLLDQGPEKAAPEAQPAEPTKPKHTTPATDIEIISGACFDICKNRGLPMDAMLAEMFPGVPKSKLTLPNWQKFHSSLL